MMAPRRGRWIALTMSGIAAVVLALIATQRDTPGSLLPHGYCFTWNPALLWTHVASDSLIGAAYVSIPITLLHLVRKREDLPFDWMLVLFALFIVSCGATHLIEVWTVWNPDYWLAASVKVVTAMASVLTAVALVALVPRILAIPTVAQLTAAKEALEQEVASRRRAEEALRAERNDLERRVSERTAALASATSAARSAHAQAEQANALKDRFLAKVSHELRTPLQSTLSWAHLLKQSAQQPDTALQAADRILHNVRTQARLIDDLLDISRILSGKLSLELAPVDATQVVHKAAEVVRSSASTRGITIDVTGDGVPTPMLTDPVRLEQVVWNLVNNAVQASADGARVVVDLRRHGAALELTVQDWGQGIDPADLGTIFEPFRQGTATHNAHRGLGLGLAITRSIVGLFGGELHAHSDGPGRGAVFRLRLPLEGAIEDAPGPSMQELGDADRHRLSSLHVLYVEDEPDIAESGRLLLLALGARVTLCTDFDSARRRVEDADFDVLLTDLDLGAGRSAHDLLALLRRQATGARVPAIVLSAYGSAQDRQRSHEAGFVAHLVKPTDSVDVARALLAALDQKSS